MGHENSFVYDIADLYKAEISIPLAFEVAASCPKDVGSEMRRRMRDIMVHNHVLERMVRDIQIPFCSTRPFRQKREHRNNYPPSEVQSS